MTHQDEPLRVWLDDDLVDRAAPPGWLHVQTAPEAIELLQTGRVVDLSLDHDLGDDERFGTGYDVLLFLAEKGFNGTDLWPRESIAIHSANFAASPRMEGVIERYAPMRRVRGQRRWLRAGSGNAA